MILLDFAADGRPRELRIQTAGRNLDIPLPEILGPGTFDAGFNALIAARDYGQIRQDELTEALALLNRAYSGASL